MACREMTCRELTDGIADYLEGDLSPEAHQRFEQHLDACSNCRKYLRSYEDTVALGKHAFDDSDAPIPDDVPDELIRAILDLRNGMTGSSAESRRRPWHPRARRP